MAKERRGFWSKFFRKPDKQLTYSLEDVLSGRTPIFSDGFGDNIYASDVVQQAIYSIVTELKKLDPVHIRQMEGANDYTVVGGNIQKVLDAPNPLMTTSDFIEKIAWSLLLNYNAFIYPVWEGKTLIGLYPLQPSTVEFDMNYGGTGKPWVRFHFPNGYVGDLPYDDIIHLRYRFARSEFMGGNENGQPDFEPLKQTLELNEILLKGLAKSLHIQTAINGVVKIKTMQNKEEQMAKVKEFEQKLMANESGLLPIDISAEYIPITKQVNLLDEKVLEFIDRKILRTFGVSIPIVNGDYTTAQYEAFYQKTLEPIVKSWAQAFTKGIFSKHAAQGFKNQIRFYEKEMIFLSMDQKLKAIDLLQDSASCMKNEVRGWLGLRPLRELEGQIASSSNKNNAMNNEQDNGSNDNGGAAEDPAPQADEEGGGVNNE